MLTLKQLIKTGFTTRQAQALVAQQPKNGLSTKRLVFVRQQTATLDAGGGTNVVNWGASPEITKGSEYWGGDGASGLGLPLDMTISSDRHGVVYPADARDAQWNLTSLVYVSSSSGATDAGKMASVVMFGNNNSSTGVAVLDENGLATVSLGLLDQVFATDTSPQISIYVKKAGAAWAGNLFCRAVRVGDLIA